MDVWGALTAPGRGRPAGTFAGPTSRLSPPGDVPRNGRGPFGDPVQSEFVDAGSQVPSINGRIAIGLRGVPRDERVGIRSGKRDGQTNGTEGARDRRRRRGGYVIGRGRRRLTKGRPVDGRPPGIRPPGASEPAIRTRGPRLGVRLPRPRRPNYRCRRHRRRREARRPGSLDRRLDFERRRGQRTAARARAGRRRDRDQPRRGRRPVHRRVGAPESSPPAVRRLPRRPRGPGESGTRSILARASAAECDRPVHPLPRFRSPDTSGVPARSHPTRLQSSAVAIGPWTGRPGVGTVPNGNKSGMPFGDSASRAR